MGTFTYRKSCPIIYWGCSFDSLLELKYALSVQHEYEFLRSRISVYYDPKTKVPTRYIRGNIRRYTPDFLIRHKESGKAFWVEIKPQGFNDEAILMERRTIAENYIRENGYDWEYKVVFSDEIRLTPEQVTQFNECCTRIRQSARKLKMEKLNRQYDRSAAPLFTRVIPPSQVQYIMYGNRKINQCCNSGYPDNSNYWKK